MSDADAPVRTRPERRRPGLLDMVISLALVVAIIAVVLLVQRRTGGPAINVIDPSPAYAGARNVAAYQVRTPEGLPAGWRPTSARTDRPEPGRLTLRVGFVTPQGEYAQLVESDLPRDRLLAAELGAGARPSGPVAVGAQTWQRFPAPRSGDRAIVRSDGAVTYLVSGSAGLEELRVLAAALR